MWPIATVVCGPSVHGSVCRSQTQALQKEQTDQRAVRDGDLGVPNDLRSSWGPDPPTGRGNFLEG